MTSSRSFGSDKPRTLHSRRQPTLEALEDRLQLSGGPIGGIDLGNLPNYLFFFANGSQDANWQSASKGFVGDVAVNGQLASERTSGTVPYAGTIFTNDSTLGAWQKIVNDNPGQAAASFGNTALISDLTNQLHAAFAQINGLTVTLGFGSRSSTSLCGLNTQDGVAETTVINVTSGFQVSSKIDITGDAGDVFVLRWDTDANPANGYQGQVKFQSGGAIVPHGGLTAGNFINVAGDINASGGGSNPSTPYPQGPRLDEGAGDLINGGKNFSGGGFFTGYWLTTGDPASGDTSSLSNAIFVGGWYTLTDKFSMTSGTSGVHVSPNPKTQEPLADLAVTKTDGVDTVTAGDGIVRTYTITVTNSGPDDAQNVSLSDTWPAGFTQGTVTNDHGIVTPGADGNFTATLGNLAVGASKSITVTYTVPASTIDDQTNTVRVSTSTKELNLANNVASDTDHVLRPQLASISGLVFLDTDGDGASDGVIPGVEVDLIGTDAQGNAVSLVAYTDENGAYSFTGLQAGTYQLYEQQPNGYRDGLDYLGTVNGASRGVLGNDNFTDIALVGGESGVNYNFSELFAGS